MKAIVIDDERLARKELIQMLTAFPDIEVMAEAGDIEEAQELIENLGPELIFLDIQMPGGSGFELLSKLDHVPHVIFVTAYDEFALRAFEVNALDYLLKPVENDRLATAIQRVQSLKPSALNNQGDKTTLLPDDQIFIKDGEKCWFVPLREIRLFESEGNYVRVYFKDFKPLILRSLNQLEERLDEMHFFRASRKHIVNLDWVENIEPWFSGGLKCTLRDGKEIEVSRRQSARFRELRSL
ncbi:MAG: response regulator [Cryomorphaceae bacterium]|nr:response regulator [Cryomorphaceae bacterium]